MPARRYTRAPLLAAGAAVIALAAGVAAIAATSDDPPQPVVDAAKAASAQAPTAENATTTNGFRVWVSDGDAGAVVSVTDTEGRLEQPLMIGCSTFVPGKTPVAICGGSETGGAGSVFVGRAAAGVTSVTASYPSGKQATAPVADGVFVVVGPTPAGGELGEAPAGVTALDEAGDQVGTYVRSGRG